MNSLARAIVAVGMWCNVLFAAETLAPPAPLSAATLDKIAHLRPLFDGKTLDGWVQAPAAPTNFSASDIIDLESLVRKLAAKAAPVTACLAHQLDEAGKAALTLPITDEKAVRATLIKNFNRLLPGLEECGVTAKLDVDATSLEHAMRFNRLLIEREFPREIARSPSSSWVVKEGAMASTGGGRGVIYTKESFTRYRLIFTMRHVSGNPEHQPCMLVFCTGPQPGKSALDALAGIQFQTPNGGHWDYRPGHNNAGNDFFTRPVRTTFDNHQWHQVELLVDAKTGIARMAVAQPVGTRAIENCVFRDPAAGKTGPIAWQMHNAGLFDEFKDVRIEVDPAEDRLITVE